MLDSADTLQVDTDDLSKLKPLGIGDILDGTFSLYRNHITLFLGVASVYLIAIVIEYSIKGFLSNPNLSKILASLISLPFAVLSMGGIVVAAATIYLGGEITSSTALKQTFRRLWTLVFCHLLWRMVQVIPLLFIVLSINSVIRTGTWALPIMSAIICIPIIIYFSVRWIFYVETVIIEKCSVGEALRRSSELVQENWWKVFGIICLILLSSSAVRYILENSLGIVLISANLAGGTDLITLIQWSIMDNVLDTKSYPFYVIMTGAQMVLKALVVPIWIIGVTLLYFDRRVRKEGYDIEIVANRPDILV